MKLIDNRQKQTQQLKAGKNHLLSFRDKSRRETQAPPTPKAQHGDGNIAAKDVVSYPSSPSHPKVGRNDLCFCGSGKKYKKCCLIKEEQEPSKETST